VEQSTVTENFKKRLTQNVHPNMIINEQDIDDKGIMLNFKSLRSASTTPKNSNMKFGEGAEVRQEQVTRSYRQALQNLDFFQKQ
jgi:hypothetical protein